MSFSMDWLTSLSGFIVGMIVGLTGVGGGSLMTPLLVLAFGIARKYLIKLGAKTVTATFSRLDARLDVQTGARRDADTLNLNDIGVAQIQTQQPVAFDAYRDRRATGGFIGIDTVTHHTVAAGMIHG